MPNLPHYRSLLQSKLQELTQSLQDREEIQIEQVSDFLDRALAVSSREVAADKVSRETKTLRLVKKALAKLVDFGDEDSYGACEDCDKDIPKSRLLVIPWAERCVVCQEEWDLSHPSEKLSRKAEDWRTVLGGKF